jgi:hypothetical protein
VAEGGPTIVTVFVVSVGSVVLPTSVTELGCVPSAVVDIEAPAEIGSVVDTVVPLSVTLDAATQAPAPPPPIRAPAAIAAEPCSFVAELKQGRPPEFTVPDTVAGNDRPVGIVQLAPRTQDWELTVVPVFTSPALGSPVAFVKTSAEGVPSAGVVSVGDVSVLFVRVCVSLVPTIVPVGAATLEVRVVALPAMPICPVVSPLIPLDPPLPFAADVIVPSAATVIFVFV